MTWTWDQYLVYIGIPALILYHWKTMPKPMIFRRDKTPWIWHEDQKLFTAPADARIIQSIDGASAKPIKFKGEKINETIY